MNNNTQTTLEEVMPAEDSWDWFRFNNLREQKKEILWYGLRLSYQGNVQKYSLADLLANPSFCKAVWGESGYYTGDEYTGIKTMREAGEKVKEFKKGLFYRCYKERSTEAFEILRDEGNQAALNYIKQTKL